MLNKPHDFFLIDAIKNFSFSTVTSNTFAGKQRGTDFLFVLNSNVHKIS